MRAVSHMKYTNAAKEATKQSNSAHTRTSDISSGSDTASKMSKVNAASFDHTTAAKHHEIASALTKDADQVAHHTMMAGKHKAAASKLSDRYNELFHQHLDEQRSNTPEPKQEMTPQSDTAAEVGRISQQKKALSTAKDAVKLANKWADANPNHPQKQHYIGKAVAQLESAVAALRETGAHDTADKYAKKISGYKKHLT